MSNRQPRLKSLCVFCGSSVGADPAHREAAGILGRTMAEQGIRLVYGGGHVGIMGALAEAVLYNGGHVVGVIPEHLTRMEAAFLEISELIVVDSMHTRKRRMFDEADAFCVLPGGMGTMDELFEIITWKQLRLHNKPIIIANNAGYWDPLIRLFDSIISGGFAHPQTAAMFTVVDRVEDVLPTAREAMQMAVTGESELF